MAYDLDQYFTKQPDEAPGPVNTVKDALAQSMEVKPEEPGAENQMDALAMVKAEQARKKEDSGGGAPPENADKGITYQRKVTHTDSRTAGRKAAKTSVSDTCEIRGFPRSLLQMVKASNGCEESSNTTALAAFVYANRDMDADVDYGDVPERVIELAATFDRYKAARQTDRNIRSINEKLRRLESDADSMVMGMVYLIYDRLGFRTDAPNTPNDVDFELYGMAELLSRMVSSARKYKKEEAYQNGRPL